MKLIKPIIPEQICLSPKPDRIAFLDIDGVLRTRESDLASYILDDIPLLYLYLIESSVKNQ